MKIGVFVVCFNVLCYTLSMKKPVLKVNNLCVNFYGSPNILNGINIEVDKNLVIFGDADCGKSLFLRAICGLVKTSGEVLLNDEPLNIKQQKTSLILNPLVLFENKTVLQNLKYACKVLKKNKEFATNVLKEFDLQNEASTKIKQLCLFKQKCVCLARAKLKKPQLLLCDEILEEQNKQEQQKLKELLSGFEDALIVFSAKDPSIYDGLAEEQKYLKFGNLCDADAVDDLFLEKQKAKVEQCYLHENAIVIGTKIIQLSKQEQEKIETECLKKDCLFFSKHDAIIKIYDGITKEFIICLKEK